jgi:hypothetical protein
MQTKEIERLAVELMAADPAMAVSILGMLQSAHQLLSITRAAIPEDNAAQALVHAVVTESLVPIHRALEALSEDEAD